MKINFKKFLSLTLGCVGLLTLGIVIYPVLYYEWQSGVKYPDIISPLNSVQKNPFAFPETDLTKSSNWFEGQETGFRSGYNTNYYSLSIPKLKIDNALVRTDSDDLSQSLTQFAGSPPPGLSGNTVVFGHSVLPIFFNAKNYISIFSTLHKLDVGDEVYVNYNDFIYKYLVESMFEVRPTDIEVLEQGVGTPYLSLITCSPPGDPRKPKRLVVRAKMAEVMQ